MDANKVINSIKEFKREVIVKFLKFIFALSLITLVACDVGAKNSKIQGEYYYGGQGIRKLDLKSGESRQVYNMPNSLVTNLSRIDNQRLIFDIQNLSNMSVPQKIVIFDLQNLESREILNGSIPVYIANHKKIIFYRNKKLSIANLDGPVSSVKEICEISSVILEPVIQVSDDEVVFENKSEGAYGLWLYNIFTDNIRKLPGLSDCAIHNSFWRSATKQLFCEGRTQDGVYTGNSFLINLDGSNKTTIPVGPSIAWWPISYIEDQDYMLFQKRKTSFLGLSEKHPVWIYDFHDGAQYQIAKDVLIGK